MILHGLLQIKKLEGYLNEAGKIAHQKGANVTQCETIEQTMNFLRSGKGAQLLIVDIKLDIPDLMPQLKNERIHIEVVACGIGDCSEEAVKAIEAGARKGAHFADEGARAAADGAHGRPCLLC